VADAWLMHVFVNPQHTQNTKHFFGNTAHIPPRHPHLAFSAQIACCAAIGGI
jgi:hypothetical protein